MEIRKIHIFTYGCQMNENDSEVVKQLLIDKGYEIVEDENEADLVILNTCAVRKKSEEKVYSHIGKIIKTGKKVGIMGCVAEKEKETLFRRGASFVLGTRALIDVPIAVQKLEDGEKSAFFEDRIDEVYYDQVMTRNSKHHAWITIIYGCNRFCTYCIVPYTRGREKSRPMEDILNEVRKLSLHS